MVRPKVFGEKIASSIEKCAAMVFEDDIFGLNQLNNNAILSGTGGLALGTAIGGTLGLILLNQTVNNQASSGGSTTSNGGYINSTEAKLNLVAKKVLNDEEDTYGWDVDSLKETLFEALKVVKDIK